jgi:uncharacterized membrane protein
VKKGNPIPGVAIATALTPLYVMAGYGTGSMEFFLSNLLVFISTVFICILRFYSNHLKYPKTKQLD